MLTVNPEKQIIKLQGNQFLITKINLELITGEK